MSGERLLTFVLAAFVAGFLLQLLAPRTTA